MHTEDRGCEIDRGLDGCHGHSHGRGLCAHLCEVSTRGCCDGGKVSDHGEESEHRHGAHDPDRTRNARKPKEESEPTAAKVNTIK